MIFFLSSRVGGMQSCALIIREKDMYAHERVCQSDCMFLNYARTIGISL